MKISRSGRQGRKPRFLLSGKDLPQVNRFKYFGLIIPANDTNFQHHIEDRCTSAVEAIASFRDAAKLSLETSIKLFNLKTLPIATYGIRLIWKHLTAQDLKQLERVKTTYLKRTLNAHRTTKNRIIFCLTGEPSLIKTLSVCLELPQTDATKLYMDSWKLKQRAIDPQFYHTPAMRQNVWKEANYQDRYKWTRLAAHGFHHKLYTTSGFHNPGSNCVCLLCGQGCEQYLEMHMQLPITSPCR